MPTPVLFMDLLTGPKYPSLASGVSSPCTCSLAWIVVAEHPCYTVAEETGSFRLADVPAGSHQLKVWHETLGETTKDVKVTFELTKK